MYPDLFKGLNLRLEDLTTYESPLVSFEGKIVILKRQIRLPIQTVGMGIVAIPPIQLLWPGLGSMP